MEWVCTELGLFFRIIFDRHSSFGVRPAYGVIRKVQTLDSSGSSKKRERGGTA
jgi:hypothetical protein